MNDSTNLDGKTRFGQVRELYNQDRDVGEGITLEALAKKSHTSVSTLSRVEKGKSEPSVIVVKVYSETFGVTPGYLLGISESEDMKAAAVVRELGLTDTTATTLKEISAFSSKESKENNLLAVVNAFLGNSELTIGFFRDLLAYLKNDDNGALGDIFSFPLKEYIKKVVGPKLRMVVEKSRKEDEFIASLSDEVDSADTPDE